MAVSSCWATSTSFFVARSLADTLVDGNLLQFGHLHDGFVSEIFQQLTYDFLFVFLLKIRDKTCYLLLLALGCGRSVFLLLFCHYLISSPDFFA